jgi:predicted DsbA family dithiol-disulfide isomerase
LQSAFLQKANPLSFQNMTIEIWSDVMCPFCYIGKRHLEIAIADFPQPLQIEIIWKSFQLNPLLKSDPDKDLYSYIAEMKGESYEWSVQAHEELVARAKAVGLTYNFHLAKVVNSFDAHRVIQMAKAQGLGNEMEERLFRAYFTEGAMISDHDTLISLAADIGLQPHEVSANLATTAFTAEVNADVLEANKFGIRGVPFFVFNRKFGISGAQPIAHFTETLQKAMEAEWATRNN